MEEICDGLDNDCNDMIDDGVTSTFYQDNDGDQYGSSLSIEACIMPPGYATNGSDCDDSNTFINPSAFKYATTSTMTAMVLLMRVWLKPICRC